VCSTSDALLDSLAPQCHAGARQTPSLKGTCPPSAADLSPPSAADSWLPCSHTHIAATSNSSAAHAARAPSAETSAETHYDVSC